MVTSIACSWISRTKLAWKSSCSNGLRAGLKLGVSRSYSSDPSSSPYRLLYSYSRDEHEKQQHVPLHNRLRKMTEGMSYTPLDLAWAGGYQLRFPNLWLRENCQCHECMVPDTRQRLIDIFKIPYSLTPKEVRTYVDRVEIDWPDGHQTQYSVEWLRKHHFGSRGPLKDSAFMAGLRSDVTQTPKDQDHQPLIDYGEVMASDKGVKKLTQTIDLLGYALIPGCPPTPEASRKLLGRLTNNGLAHKRDFWDSTTVAPTKAARQHTPACRLHTDSSFATEPPRIKMTHLLPHNGKGEWAEELVLSDGFEAARVLLREDHLNFTLLSRIHFYAHGGCEKNAIVQPAIPFPVLNLHPTSGVLYQIRWNNENRAPRSDYNSLSMHTWYIAARKLVGLMGRETMKRSFQLEPGTPIIFDNWRMLHGTGKSVGPRRICGGYVKNDDFVSRLITLRDGREQIIRNL